MNLIRPDRKNFVTLNVEALETPELSWTAKGIHTYLLSRPPEWSGEESDLINLLLISSLDGGDAVRSALHELEVQGFIAKEGDTYHVFETKEG